MSHNIFFLKVFNSFKAGPFFFSVKSTERCVYMMMAEHRCITKWGNYAAQSLGLLSVLMGSAQRQQGYGVSLNCLLSGESQRRMR
jgi:hypothetical protein